MLHRYKYFLIIFYLLTVACTTQPDAYDSNGNPINLNQYRGRWVIINYWASWCSPCLQEMPALNTLYNKYKKSLIILGVNYDRSSDTELQQFAAQYKIEYPLLNQFPLRKISTEEVGVLPMTFIINPQGKLVKTLKGPRPLNDFQSAIQGGI